MSSSNGHNARVTVAVDAMGGDYGPSEMVQGAQMAVERGAHVILVGRPESIHACLDSEIPVIEATDLIDMHEAPTVINKRPDSSLAKAINLVSMGEADAAVSAGNSGAIMAGALLAWGRQPGVLRPAYGGEMPTRDGHTFILDIGANSEIKPEYLVQFAIMGTAYMQVAKNMAHPRVGLLCNGTEEGKGTAITREAHALIQRIPHINFIGNVEANQVFESAVDIVVTDGFTGNILLKTAEGVASEIFNLIRSQINRDPISRGGAMLLRPALRRIKRRLDYEEYGGTPLLGVNGVMINAHGKSRAKAIANAIVVADRVAREHLVQRIGGELQEQQTEHPRRMSRVARRLHIPVTTRPGRRDPEE